MRCPKCGRVNREDAIYCWNCHVKFSDIGEKKTEKVHKPEVREEKSESKELSEFKKKATYLLMILGILLIIILGVTIYLFLYMR